MTEKPIVCKRCQERIVAFQVCQLSNGDRPYCIDCERHYRLSGELPEASAPSGAATKDSSPSPAVVTATDVPLATSGATGDGAGDPASGDAVPSRIALKDPTPSPMPAGGSPLLDQQPANGNAAGVVTHERSLWTGTPDFSQPLDISFGHDTDWFALATRVMASTKPAKSHSAHECRAVANAMKASWEAAKERVTWLEAELEGTLSKDDEVTLRAENARLAQELAEANALFAEVYSLAGAARDKTHPDSDAGVAMSKLFDVLLHRWKLDGLPPSAEPAAKEATEAEERGGFDGPGRRCGNMNHPDDCGVTWRDCFFLHPKVEPAKPASDTTAQPATEPVELTTIEQIAASDEAWMRLTRIDPNLWLRYQSFCRAASALVGGEMTRERYLDEVIPTIRLLSASIELTDPEPATPEPSAADRPLTRAELVKALRDFAEPIGATGIQQTGSGLARFLANRLEQEGSK